MNDLNSFLSRFNFRKNMVGYVGIEREHFLVSLFTGKYVPLAVEFLNCINDPRWTYELSACQVEVRTAPHADLKTLYSELIKNEAVGGTTARKLGCMLVNQDVSAKDMPLDVYPDRRYHEEIVPNLTKEQLRAACRVAGTHTHIGVKDMHQAIHLSNILRPYIQKLVRLGDHSHGERFRLYKVVAPYWMPPYYKGVRHFFETAQKQGFAKNPRNCWHIIRISIHGTVELRIFGAALNANEIIGWVEYVQKIIKKEGGLE